MSSAHGPPRERLLLAAALLALGGCDPDPGPARPRGGPDAPTDGATPCAELTPLYAFFDTCLECHNAESRVVNLEPAALGDLIGRDSDERPGHVLVVPGSPDTSELYLRLVGPIPAGHRGSWYMPQGRDEPYPADVVREWIASGAEVCGTPPPPPQITDPNRYDQDRLFTCTDPTAPASSPARFRRINDDELTAASGFAPSFGATDDVVVGNPLGVNARYSTLVEDSVDEVTLSLLMTTLEAASRPWETPGQGSAPGGRWQAVYETRLMVPAVYNNPADGTAGVPDDQRDLWVDLLLRHGTLFRAPTTEEHAAIRGLLDQLLSEEPPEATWTSADRHQTLNTVTSAAHLLVGALFRSEIGTGTAEGARRRLSDDELALALGRVLSAHPVSATLYGSPPDGSTNPNWVGAPTAAGWLADLRAAADADGELDTATIAALVAEHWGGIDATRADVLQEMDDVAPTRTHDELLRIRGEHWLSDGIVRFFREWLDVDDAEGAFKASPEATSAFSGNPVIAGYDRYLANGEYRRETMLPLLDDTIARTVIEAESGGDAFRDLLTTRTFRVPSNLTALGDPCTSQADCGPVTVELCHPSVGRCVAIGSTDVGRAFGITGDVADTRDARWMSMPPDERAGVLTHPAWLAAHGGAFEDGPSMIYRGHWIRENLLCSDVGGLERVTADARLEPSRAVGDTHFPETEWLTARERVTHATELGSEVCSACHGAMNPLGAPFEMFNHAGFLRAPDYFTHDTLGTASTLTDSTSIPTFGLEGDYADAIALVEALAESPHARRCFIRNVFRFFMGRSETPADACTLVSLEAAFAGGSFLELLQALVTSDAFLYRHTEGATP